MLPEHRVMVEMLESWPDNKRSGIGHTVVYQLGPSLAMGSS